MVCQFAGWMLGYAWLRAQEGDGMSAEVFDANDPWIEGMSRCIRAFVDVIFVLQPMGPYGVGGHPNQR